MCLSYELFLYILSYDDLFFMHTLLPEAGKMHDVARKKRFLSLFRLPSFWEYILQLQNFCQLISKIQNFEILLFSLNLNHCIWKSPYLLKFVDQNVGLSYDLSLWSLSYDDLFIFTHDLLREACKMPDAGQTNGYLFDSVIERIQHNSWKNIGCSLKQLKTKQVVFYLYFKLK